MCALFAAKLHLRSSQLMKQYFANVLISEPLYTLNSYRGPQRFTL